jgi:preprotein translocase SecE subunit
VAAAANGHELANTGSEAEADAQVTLGPELADGAESEELEGIEEPEMEVESPRAEVTTRHKGGHVEHKPSLVSRLFGFLRGSWMELQRVQWPDRKQVMQATGVVVGFVIVAGVFLGVADLISSKLVHLLIQ